MPWLETDPMLERHHFVQDLESGHWTMTELCVRYGIRRSGLAKLAEASTVRGSGRVRRPPLRAPQGPGDESGDPIG
jgi:hypothetical protein